MSTSDLIPEYVPIIQNVRVVQREYVHPDLGLQSTEFQFQVQEAGQWRPIQVIRETIVLARDGTNVTIVPTQWINDEDAGE